MPLRSRDRTLLTHTLLRALDLAYSSENDKRRRVIMAKTISVIVALIFTIKASWEKYQVDVALPLSSSNVSYNLTVPEGETLTVCVVRSITTQRLGVVVKGETNPQTLPALGGIDYSPTAISLVFERSLENQTKCGEFSMIQDGLDEGQETFFLSISQDNDLVIPGGITVNIDACKQGDIILTKSVRESFSAVEYCKNSTQWVTLCDESNEWTLDDAMVACRQTGRSGGQVTYHQSGNKIWNARGAFPQCAGYEHCIDDCNSINTTKECRPVLINCGLVSGSDNNSSDGVWILIVTAVPPLLLIILTVFCAIVIRVVWKKWTYYRSDRQQSSNPDDDLKVVPNAAYASVHHSSSTRPDP